MIFLKKKVIFIKPALETDLIWEPVRSCSYLGIWFLASILKNSGYVVYYFDEVYRDNGMKNREVILRQIFENEILNKNLDVSPDKIREEKRWDYNNLSVSDFLQKYSVFKGDRNVKRLIQRTGLSQKRTLDDIALIKPDIIGIPITASANYLESIRLGKEIKERFPKVKLIYGGQHCSADWENMIKYDWIDHIIIGDAIEIIEDLVEGNISQKIASNSFVGINNFPELDPVIIEKIGYPAQPNYTFPTQGKFVDYMFSRGCNRKCNFCVAGSDTNNYFSSKDHKKLDTQLKLFKKFGYHDIVVQDDCFPGPKKHLNMILKVMKENGFNWQINGGTEFEKLSKDITEMIIHYNQSGQGKCTHMYIPFNPREWNNAMSSCQSMTSKFSNNLENVKNINDSGINTYSSVMLGTPDYDWATFKEDLEKTKELLVGGYFSLVMCFAATILPGTKWHRENNNFIINKNDFNGYSIMMPHCGTKKLSVQEIEEMIVIWHKELDNYQKTYSWQTGLPNS